MMKEEWRPCAEYEDCYWISSYGTLARTATFSGRPCWKIRAPAHKNGYRCYHMCKNGIRLYRFAHLLVWRSFNGQIPDGLEINHKDGDRDNPQLENLEAVTRSQNATHSFRVLGRANFNVSHYGSRNGSAKLTERDIPEIFRLYAKGMYQWQIAEQFGVSQPAIGFILRGKAWRHIRMAPR